ncbi:hypothetical protein EVAR_20021_1 [Eumeta japonica]|uniref:Uncharacterized protein n=1 Tax=Eumeta variegata TaxID=151549 RepID=A0A4C1V9M9_EUMVA|nr:hypothetical protein EVAR_20021_1 [Eumeta japonica]
MSSGRMERAGRRAKAGSLSGLCAGASGGGGASAVVRRQRSLEWAGERYSSSDDERAAHPQLADRVFASLLAQATQQFDVDAWRMRIHVVFNIWAGRRGCRLRISAEFVIHRATWPKVRREPQQVGSLVRARGGGGRPPVTLRGKLVALAPSNIEI